ncbi:MAG: hypothetical protein ABWY16_09355 [Pedobacter sp.]|uniref:hypothetical protein n=1 Tax=Pedobacter sp. TaxID=1411316 RepID=UPI0033929EA1
MLPYNGEKLEFIAKNMRIPFKRVFDVLSVIDLTADELVLYLVNERLKNRERHLENYTDKLFR